MDEHAAIEWQQPQPPMGLPLPVEVDASQRTPVFSTNEPNPGLAAAIRRQAYTYPSHRTMRWLLLLMADRVESGGLLLQETVIPGRQPAVVRHYARQLRSTPTGFALVGLALAGLVLVRRARRTD